jgi:hypothetical protein
VRALTVELGRVEVLLLVILISGRHHPQRELLLALLAARSLAARWLALG